MACQYCRPAILFLAFVIDAAFALAIVGFLVMHCRMIARNMTTIEMYEKRRHSTGAWPFDRGAKQNFLEVFGRRCAALMHCVAIQALVCPRCCVCCTASACFKGCALVHVAGTVLQLQWQICSCCSIQQHRNFCKHCCQATIAVTQSQMHNLPAAMFRLYCRSGQRYPTVTCRLMLVFLHVRSRVRWFVPAYTKEEVRELLSNSLNSRPPDLPETTELALPRSFSNNV